MLQLGTGMRTIDGVDVFPDNADPEQFWYLPKSLALTLRAEDQRPSFTFLKFKRAATEAEGVRGGGFLMFGVELTLPEDVERDIRSEIGAGAKLTSVPFDSGTVRCVALNLQGPGGTVAEVAADGSFIAVEQILGASVPSLFSGNTAIFSLTLSEEGATLLEAAFAEGATPIGVIYDLTFTAMQPALDVVITADLERVYKHFSAGLNANIYYVEIGVEVGLEELRQAGAITIDVTNYSTDASKLEQEQWALKFFTDHLLSQWFTPTLTPGTLQGGMATAPRAGGGGIFAPGGLGGQGGQQGGQQGGGQQGGQQGRGQQGGQQGGPPQPPPPPPPPGGGTNPQPPPPPPPPGGGSPGGGNPPQPPPAGGGANPPPPAGQTVQLVIDFSERGGPQGVHGRYSVTVSSGAVERTVQTQGGDMVSQLMLDVPAEWRHVEVTVTASALPVLTPDDREQVRAVFAGTAAGTIASGERPAQGVMNFEEVDLDPARPETRNIRVSLPATETRITAANADALIGAVFPGGQLAQAGVYDVRRTNDGAFIMIAVADPDGIRVSA